MYDDIVDHWYLKKNHKRRTFVYHGYSNCGKSTVLELLEPLFHTFCYMESRGNFNERYFRTEYEH